MSLIKDINIVVIGKSGVGKTTFVNSIPLYHKFKNFSELSKHFKNGSFKPLIPTHFTHEMEDLDGNLITKEIKIGESDNENCEIAESHTLEPRNYTIHNEDHLKAGFRFHVFDTPGICDTRNCDTKGQDEENMQKIVECVAGLTHLNLIVVLLEPNQQRLDKDSKYVIEGLLKNFHQSAAPNIVFAFTHSSDVYFKPGSTVTSLKKFFIEISDKQGVKIEFEENTTFYFDNEYFEYLCFMREEPEICFPKQKRMRCEKGFRKTRDEFARLIQYAKTVKPHDPQFTAMLNYTRHLIPCLTGPVTKAATGVEETLKKIEDCEAKLETYKGREHEYNENLYEKFTKVRYRYEVERKTKCKNCSVLKHYRGNERIPIIEANPEVADKDPLSLWYGTFAPLNDEGEHYCPECGPDFKSLTVVATYYSTVEEEIKENPDISVKLDENKKKQQSCDHDLANFKALSGELAEERDVMLETLAKFGAFMDKYSLVPYTDKAETFMDGLINLENMKENRVKAALYEKMKLQYQQKRGIFKNNSAAVSDLTPDEMNAIISDLTKLKHYGKDIEDAIGVVKETDGKSYEEFDVHIEKKPLTTLQKLGKFLLKLL